MGKNDVKCESCGAFNLKNARTCRKCGRMINVVRRYENRFLYFAMIECIFMAFIKIFYELSGVNNGGMLWSGLQKLLPTFIILILDKICFAFGLAIIIKWIFSKKKGFTRIPLFIIYIILFILFTTAEWKLIITFGTITTIIEIITIIVVIYLIIKYLND